MTADDEIEAIKRLVHSRTEPERAVERARIVWLVAHEGRTVSTIAETLYLDYQSETVRLRIRRFNAEDGRLGR